MDLMELFGGLGKGLNTAAGQIHENWLMEKKRREEMEDWQKQQAIRDQATTDREVQIRKMIFEEDKDMQAKAEENRIISDTYGNSPEYFHLVNTPLDPKAAATAPMTQAGIPLPLLQKVVAISARKKLTSGEPLSDEDKKNLGILSPDVQGAILAHNFHNINLNADLEAKIQQRKDEAERLSMAHEASNLQKAEFARGQVYHDEQVKDKDVMVKKSLQSQMDQEGFRIDGEISKSQNIIDHNNLVIGGIKKDRYYNNIASMVDKKQKVDPIDMKWYNEQNERIEAVRQSTEQERVNLKTSMQAKGELNIKNQTLMNYGTDVYQNYGKVDLGMLQRRGVPVNVINQSLVAHPGLTTEQILRAWEKYQLEGQMKDVK